MLSLYSDLYQLAVNQHLVALYSTAGSKLAVKMIAVIKTHSTGMVKLAVFFHQTQVHASRFEC